MESKLNRRSFIKRAALAAGSVSCAQFAHGPNLLLADQPGKKLNCVQIGCGVRGLGTHLDWLITQSQDNLVAIVDPDEARHAKVREFLKEQGQDPAKLKVLTNYPVLFTKNLHSIDSAFAPSP